jgi:hypothetical protein
MEDAYKEVTYGVIPRNRVRFVGGYKGNQREFEFLNSAQCGGGVIDTQEPCQCRRGGLCGVWFVITVLLLVELGAHPFAASLFPEASTFLLFYVCFR